MHFKNSHYFSPGRPGGEGYLILTKIKIDGLCSKSLLNCCKWTAITLNLSSNYWTLGIIWVDTFCIVVWASRTVNFILRPVISNWYAVNFILAKKVLFNWCIIIDSNCSLDLALLDINFFIEIMMVELIFCELASCQCHGYFL